MSGQKTKMAAGKADRQPPAEDRPGSAAGAIGRRAATPGASLLVPLLIVVAAATAVTHWPALSAQALAIDDDQYLTNNHLVQNPSWTSAGRFLTEVLEPSTVAGYYQPLAMISLMIDYGLGGRPYDLRQFHRTSLALHVANTALVFLLLYLLFQNAWAAALIALLFGVHPLTVEAIPWVGERKTLLATFFALGCLILYVLNARRADWRLYGGSVALCVLALMSKPTTTPLPLLLLLLDYWPLRRLNTQAIWDKTPFFLVAGIAAIVTFVSQNRAAATALPTEYELTRIPLVVCHNIVFYLGKMAWPANLSAYYAFPKPLGISQPAVLAGVMGTAAGVAVLLISLRWTRAALTGGLFFFIALAPTLGLIGFTTVIASDKYVYLPAVGVLLTLTALLAHLWSPAPGIARRGAMVLVVLILAMTSTASTRSYLAVWRNTDTLFQHMLRLAPEAAILHNNYGVVLASQDRIEDALEHYQEAVRLKPDFWMARTNIGIALRELDRLDEEEDVYRRMVADAPRNSVAHFNLANALVKQDRLDEACAEYAEAVRLTPTYAQAYTNWGVALVEAGQSQEAIARLRKALALNADDATAHFNLALALASQGEYERAVTHYREALRVTPESPRVYTNLGLALAALGQLNEAVHCLRMALDYDPDDALAHVNLGVLAFQAGFPKAAEEHLRAALKSDPTSVEANNNLGVLLTVQGRAEEAIPFLTEAVRLEPDHANAHFMLGQALAALSRFNEAIAHYARVIELQPRDAEAYGQLAKAYAATGDFPQASASVQQALALAQEAGNTELAAHFEEQLRAYGAGLTSAPASQPAQP